MCLYPTLIDNPKYKSNKKNGGKIPHCIDKRIKKVPIGCGYCEECRRKKAGEWYIRLENEFRNNTERCRFITLTFNEESLNKYIELAREEIKEKKNKVDTKKGIDIRNIACKIAIRRWLERIRSKTKKSIRHWVITELGGGHSKRIHMHGFIWDEQGVALKEWKNGYVYEGDYMSNKAITYTTKYMLKINEQDKMYVPKIMCSAGIGAERIKSIGAKRAKYVPHGTLEEYRGIDGIKRGLPMYYRNKIYSETEREKLWIEKLDKGERWIGKSCIKRKNYETEDEFEKACIEKLEEERRSAAIRRNIEIKEYDKEKYRKQLYQLRSKKTTVENKKKLTESEIWEEFMTGVEKNIAERNLKRKQQLLIKQKSKPKGEPKIQCIGDKITLKKS